MKKSASRRGQPRLALSLIELVISMSLLSIIMLPVVALMATSYKVYNASSAANSNAYVRQAALDVVTVRLQRATRVNTAGTNFLNLRLASGGSARLTYSGGRLTWREGANTELLVEGLSNARLSVGAAPGAGASAGELILLEVGSRGAGDPSETWSRTQIWIKPTL